MILEPTKELLNKRISDFFVKLQFNEELHKYTLDNRVLVSVSKIVEQFAEKVNWTQKAAGVAYKTNSTLPLVLNDWKTEKDKSIILGHKTHHFGEILGPNSRKPVNTQEQAILNFWANVDPKRYIRVSREVRMYHKSLYYAGTCDFILYDTVLKGFIIGDYKSNKDLFKNFKEKKLLYPFDLMLDQPFSKYEIQLTLYQILLSQLNIPVVDRWIVWLLPEHKCKEKGLPYGSYKNYKGRELLSPMTNWLYKQNTLFYYNEN